MSGSSRRTYSNRAATINDVALEAGVSSMTVSRMINGKSIKQSSIDNIKNAIKK